MTANQILILNAGSSSIKFSIYDLMPAFQSVYEGEVSGIGTPDADLNIRVKAQQGDRESQKKFPIDRLQTFHQAVGVISELAATLSEKKPAAIGHRVVHSGPILKQHQKITPEVFELIKQSTPFAPLHQPLAIEMIESSRLHFPDVDNYACFDTIFHESLPEAAFTYALPKEIRDLGIRRYGFHGLSCESVIQRLKDGRIDGNRMSRKVPSRLIIAHLGNGASVTAVVDGCSVDTTMGLTPCGGVIMGTRSGDLDPGVIFRLLRMQSGSENQRVDAVEKMVNTQSGMKAISAFSQDMRELRKASEENDACAQLAIEIFTRNIKKAIGGYIALMGTIDAIVFTGGIGEHDLKTRQEICQGLGPLGIKLDPVKNVIVAQAARPISIEGASPQLYVFPADENDVIAKHVLRMLTLI